MCTITNYLVDWDGISMMMIMMMMMLMNCFCGMVDQRRHLALLPAGTITRDFHYRESSTRQKLDLNLRRT